MAVTTSRRRLWGWSVDGERDASDERVYESDAPGVFAFRAGERKVVRHRWSGRFKRTRGERTRWVDPDPGVHEVRRSSQWPTPARRTPSRYASSDGRRVRPQGCEASVSQHARPARATSEPAGAAPRTE